MFQKRSLSNSFEKSFNVLGASECSKQGPSEGSTRGEFQLVPKLLTGFQLNEIESLETVQI